MTINQQILECAISMGYNQMSPIDDRIIGCLKITRPFDLFGIFENEWWLENGYSTFKVTDAQLKQWQRDFKLKELGV